MKKREELSLKEILKDWSKTYSIRENAKEAWHLVFSVDENYLSPKSINALKESVKDAMDFNFFGHKYAMVLHTHQAKPHIHIILNKYNFLENKRIHFKNKSDIKYFYNNLRNDFSYALKARGLNYENRSSLEKDLSLEYLKLQRPQKNLELDTKFGINLIFQDFNESFTKKIQSKTKRINELRNEFDLSKEKYKEHYKEQFQSVVQKKNFLKTYERLFPKHKGASKKEMQNYYRIRKSLLIEEKEAEKSLKLYSENFYKDLFYENITLFKLEKQYKILDENIYLLKTADFFLREASEPYVKQLEKNKEFIKELSQKRFETIEKMVLERKDKQQKENFIFKEYSKGCEFLNKENKIKKSILGEKKPFSGAYHQIQEKYNNKSNSNSKPLNHNSNRGF